MKQGFSWLQSITHTTGDQKKNERLPWIYNLWIIISFIMITSSIMYYTFRLSSIFFIILAVVIILLVIARDRYLWASDGKRAITLYPSVAQSLIERRGILSSLVFLLLTTGTILFFILPSATLQTVRSPWELMGGIVPFLFIPLSLLLTIILAKTHNKKTAIVGTISLLFLFICLAVLLFPIGYGFDGFIHRATEEYIAAHGTITPKPFYYIGQYSLVLFFHHVFHFPISTVNTFLLPILTAISLPLAWIAGTKTLAKNQKKIFFPLSSLFFLPLSSFIVTTPQGLANLWTLLMILWSVTVLIKQERSPLWPGMIGTIATCLIHPIAGLPLLIFLSFLILEKWQPLESFPTFKKTGRWFIAIIGILIVPTGFVFQALHSGQSLPLSFSYTGLMAMSPYISSLFTYRFHPILDFVYVFQTLLPFLLVGAAIFAAWKYRDTFTKSLHPFLFMSAILFGNYVLMGTFLNFPFLIDYERSNYTDRLIPLMFFFLTPFLILFFLHLSERLETAPRSIRYFSFGLIACLMASSFYLTYPRVDAYETSHGWNVSQNDLDIVHQIETDASDKEYIVLANQNVSAAAIKELGFKKYYGDLFFYPIPTGGKLYGLFLEMNDKPNQKTTEAAMDLTHTKQAYYIVNKYWWQSDRIIETAKTNANRWWKNSDGTIYVFEYER